MMVALILFLGLSSLVTLSIIAALAVSARSRLSGNQFAPSETAFATSPTDYTDNLLAA